MWLLLKAVSVYPLQLWLPGFAVRQIWVWIPAPPAPCTSQFTFPRALASVPVNWDLPKGLCTVAKVVEAGT